MSFAKLDPARIRAETLRLFRDEGLEGVGIRRLAASLEVRPSSLYWHVRDKEALHAMLSEDLFRACLDAVPYVAGWDEWLRGLGIALWEAQTAMPDIRKLIIANITPYEVTSALRRQIVEALIPRGMPEAFAMVAQHSVLSLATGWATLNDHHHDALEERAPFLEALTVLIEGWRARVSARA